MEALPANRNLLVTGTLSVWTGPRQQLNQVFVIAFGAETSAL